MKTDTIILITMTIVGILYLWVCSYIVYLVSNTWMLFPVIVTGIIGIFIVFYITMVIVDLICVVFGKD